jgi:uncharacterized membrane-anchored protein YhcB (DUF1043 family)
MPAAPQTRRWPYVLVAIIAVVVIAGLFEDQRRQMQMLRREVKELENKVESLQRELRDRPPLVAVRRADAL